MDEPDAGKVGGKDSENNFQEYDEGDFHNFEISILRVNSEPARRALRLAGAIFCRRIGFNLHGPYVTHLAMRA